MQISFAPLFSEITDSSIWEEPYHVRISWITMMARKQADQVAYCDAYRLKKWANLDSIEEAEDALKVLSSPDTRRLGQLFEGRRIEQVEGGWRLLNGRHYEDLARTISERVRKARWAREHRAKSGGGVVKQPGVKSEIGVKDLQDHVDKGTPLGDERVDF
jgi:hypothetical protein